MLNRNYNLSFNLIPNARTNNFRTDLDRKPK